MSLFKSASIVSLLTLLSRITGLLRELLIASTFGANALTDAFNVAFRIPNLFRRFFALGRHVHWTWSGDAVLRCGDVRWWSGQGPRLAR